MFDILTDTHMTCACTNLCSEFGWILVTPAWFVESETDLTRLHRKGRNSFVAVDMKMCHSEKIIRLCKYVDVLTSLFVLLHYNIYIYIYIYRNRKRATQFGNRSSVPFL